MTLREKFRSSIKRGTGEAHLILIANPNVDFSNEIIKAATFIYQYDTQIEDDRAPYIFDLITLSKNKEKIRKAILKNLQTETKDGGALELLFNLAKFFALQGDSGAKKAIYKRYGKKIIWGCPWNGERAIIELDGFEGLKYIVNSRGEKLLKNPDDWETEWLLDDFLENHPEVNVYKAIEKEATNNKFIKTYLDRVLKSKNVETIGRPEQTKDNYDTVKKRIDLNQRVPLTPRGAKELSKDDIKRLADDFLMEKKRIRLEKYMRIFDRVKYPYQDYSPILEIAKKQYSRRDRLIEYAVEALKYFKGTDIREFAMKILSEPVDKSLYINLLVSNYKKGDYKILSQIAEKAHTVDMTHKLASGFIDVYTANKTRECQLPLLAIYNNLVCGNCRKKILSILIENGVLPDHIKKEIEFDSEAGIRELMKML
jgi:hypothetical protein